MKRSALDDICARIDDGDELRRRLAGPFRRAIRVHARRGSPCGWGELEAIPWSAAGRLHADAIDPGTRLDYHTGSAYPQDAASQLPVLLLAPQPGETVVDCCAAPGSKSTQIGLALADDGLLVCCDASPPRRRALRENLARQGVACALVTPLPLERLLEGRAGCADAALVDAPCSGHDERSYRQTARAGLRQGAILKQAAQLVRPGGRMVYSTCTPYPAENEDVVRHFLEHHRDWRLEPVRMPGVDADLDGLGALRLWPQRQGCEPFFACLLLRDGAGYAAGLTGRLPAAGEALLPGLHCWEHDGRHFAATMQAASCALPSEARGLLLGRLRDGLRDADIWAQQAAIDRGLDVQRIEHQEACRLWAGEELERPAGLLATVQGAPLGWHDGRRLCVPSRLRRTSLR